LNRGRLLKLALVLGLCVVIVGGGVMWALPALIRRVAAGQISYYTGRAASIGHVRVNPFTGWLSIRDLRLAERKSTNTFLDVPQLELRFVPSTFLRSEVRLTELTLVAPSMRVVRTTSGELNLSDLLASIAASQASPRRWTVTVDRLTISNGSVHAHDEAVTPPIDWQVRELSLELGPVTTRAGAAPGRGTARARIDEAKLDLTSEALTLNPLAAFVKIALDGFELRRLGPYMSYAGAPYHVKGGRLGAAITATLGHDGEQLTKAALSGTVSVEDEAVTKTGHDDPFLEIPHATVNVKEADLITRSLSISSAAIERARLRARRDARGVIDLVDIFGTTAGGTAPPGAATVGPPPTVSRRLVEAVGALTHRFERMHVERITLGPSTATLTDEAVKPPTTLALTGIQTTITDFTWPPQGPAAVTFSAALPGGGTVDASGSVIAQPFDAQLATEVRNANMQPYQAYVPGVAKLRGRVGGNSRTSIALKNGTLLLASKGTSWGQGIEVWKPHANRPAIRVERMDIAGIDFEWPRRGRVAKVTFRRPEAEIVREADGSFDVAKLLTVPAPPAAPEPAAFPRSERTRGPRAGMTLDFREIRVENGFVRFLDRTTTPAFSKDLSRLALVVNNFGNRPGRRARLEATSIVAGDSTVDLRGELNPIGSPVFVDLVGMLERLPLASINPYAGPAIGWVIKNGELDQTMHFTLDARAVDVTNELVVGQLQVAPAGATDEVRRRLGMPLDLIVALAKDRRGEIRVTIPVTGSLNDPQFDLRDVIWTAVRRAVATVVLTPFSAISRAVRNVDAPEAPIVDPVTFAPGSSVISSDMEQHLLRVADVLRRSPFVNLALAPATGPADVEALKTQALNARLRAFQVEHGLSSGPGVVAAYFAERFPNIELPTGVDRQLALLREREPSPDAPLSELSRRRLDATRERLVSVEGIPAERLVVAATTSDAKLSAGGGGGVELAVVAGGE